MPRQGADEEWGSRPQLVHHIAYAACEAAKRELFACIKGDDDRQRLHSALKGLISKQAEPQAA